MKRKWVAVLSMALSAVPMVGCGTIRNLKSDHPRAFGGLANDLGAVSSSDLSRGPSHQSAFPEGFNGDPRGLLLLLGLVAGLGATELCATGVADTLCLPYFYYRDGELFPKDPRSDDTRDFSTMPAQDTWPSLKTHCYSSANCVWNQTSAWYSGSESATDERDKWKEQKKEPASPAKLPEAPESPWLRELVSAPETGQSDEFRAYWRSSKDTPISGGTDPQEPSK